MVKIEVIEVASKKGDPPFRTFVQIRLAEYPSDSYENILLSPDLMTEKEVDESVNFLVEQLEKARNTAKRILKK